MSSIKTKILNLENCESGNICLIDVDSSIPNIALMKISGFFRKYGYAINLLRLNFSAYDHDKREKIILDGTGYDKVFISTLFTINKNFVEVINCKEIYQGGTGYDYMVKLPNIIEHAFPDYNLYENNEYSMGYLTRGCIRNCAFCFIPKKEGKLRLHGKLDEFYDPKLPKIMLLDNNLLASKHCIRLLKKLKKTGKKITFKQGLDFRLLTEEKAKHILDLNYDGDYIFAFDCIKDKFIIEKNFKFWKKLTKEWRTKFFVLVGYDSTLKEDLERVYFLRENKCLPYIMRHTNCYTSPNRPFYTDLAAWCNQPSIFKKMSFKEFIKRRHCTKDRYDQTMKIIKENHLKIY